MKLGLVVFLLMAVCALAQEKAEEHDDAGLDTDPMKPVLFSFRNEYFDLPGEGWQNVVLIRGDRIMLEKAKLPGQMRGVTLRADIPFVTFNNGVDSTSGLGDAYIQGLVAPRIKGTNFVAIGSGLQMPTASDPRLGRGKWVIAPAIVPLRYFPKKGLAFIKFQDWWGFAGDGDRADVHYMTITPLYLRRIGRTWWTTLDGESNTNWERDGLTHYKAGALIGHMFSPRTGLTLKLEVPFGENQATDFIVKVVLFRTRF